jgi:hypothetical protein
MATGGVDNSVIHMIPLTRPTGNGGNIYEGMDGAVLYCRSSDGGATWDPENLLLDDINSARLISAAIPLERLLIGFKPGLISRMLEDEDSIELIGSENQNRD